MSVFNQKMNLIGELNNILMIYGEKKAKTFFGQKSGYSSRSAFGTHVPKD